MITVTAQVGEKVISAYYLPSKLFRIEIPEGLDNEEWERYSAATDVLFEKLSRVLNDSGNLTGFKRIEHIVQSLCRNEKGGEHEQDL